MQTGGGEGGGGEDDAGSRSQLVRCSLTLEMQDESRVTEISGTLGTEFPESFCGTRKEGTAMASKDFMQWAMGILSHKN